MKSSAILPKVRVRNYVGRLYMEEGPNLRNEVGSFSAATTVWGVASLRATKNSVLAVVLGRSEGHSTLACWGRSARCLGTKGTCAGGTWAVCWRDPFWSRRLKAAVDAGLAGVSGRSCISGHIFGWESSCQCDEQKKKLKK